MMQRNRQEAPLRLLALVLAVAFAGGCGPSIDLDLAPASGRVTLAGQPVPGGVVTFVPDVSRGTSGPTGSGQLQSDGTFVIETAGRPGGLVGHHRVRINLYLRGEGDTSPHVELPERYMNEANSGLTAEVVAGQNNSFPLELEP